MHQQGFRLVFPVVRDRDPRDTPGAIHTGRIRLALVGQSLKKAISDRPGHRLDTLAFLDGQGCDIGLQQMKRKPHRSAQCPDKIFVFIGIHAAQQMVHVRHLQMPPPLGSQRVKNVEQTDRIRAARNTRDHRGPVGDRILRAEFVRDPGLQPADRIHAQIPSNGSGWAWPSGRSKNIVYWPCHPMLTVRVSPCLFFAMITSATSVSSASGLVS